MNGEEGRGVDVKYDRRRWDSSWNARDFVRGTGFIRLKREFQLGVNGRYEISGGLKRNALSTAIRITRIGLADIPVVLPFLKKRKKRGVLFKRAISSSLCPFPPYHTTVRYQRGLRDSRDFRSRAKPGYARIRVGESFRKMVVERN